MSDSIQYNTATSLLNNVLADYNALTGGEATTRTTSSGSSSTGSDRSSGCMTGELRGLLNELSDLLQRISDLIGGDSTHGTGSGSGSSGSGSTGSGCGEQVIAGTGRIWGDPHFIGQDGGKYDVQGQAGKTYNLLSDRNFQMNGTFEAWGSGGATVVGEVGISAGTDQVKVDKDGTVTVNGRELADCERVELADGGYVEKKGANVTVESGEWKVAFQTKGNHINMDVSTENAIADGVKPHGLLGQTFDADDCARNGDKGKGAQGGGAIEGADGITKRGDKSTVEMYEVDGLYDRNFTEFNQFFDGAESGQYSSEIERLLGDAFATIGQSLMMFSRVMNSVDEMFA